jgi:hypothetical protein
MAKKSGPQYQMSHAHRDKIANSNILNALLEHVEGRREMSSTQVQAGLGLLRKVMPDMATVDLNASGTFTVTLAPHAKSL